MRKKGLLGLFIALLTFTALGFVACEKKTEVKPIPHTHNFTRKQAKDEFIKTPATCTEKAEYYVSCACGEKSEETFFGNARLGHTGEDCTRCGNHVVTYGLEYELSDDCTYCTVTGAGGDYWVEDLVIPATYQGFPVRAIADKVFWKMDNIKSVTLGANITHMGGYAFYECENLETVVFNEQLERLGEWAFACTNIYEAPLPDTLQSLGNGTFDRCENLTEITLPDSVSSLGDYAFNDCTNLKTVTLNDGLTEIGNSCFSKCSDLEKIAIPDSVTHLGERAFGDCYNLKELTIGSGIQSINEDAFIFCWSLKEVVIPDTVVDVGKNAFRQCDNLAKLTIGKSVERIGEDAFLFCESLWDITIRSRSLQVPSEAFLWSGSSKTIRYEGTMQDWFAFTERGGLLDISVKELYINGELIAGELRIPNGFETIPSGAFQNCYGITSLTIPDSVTAIDDYAFAYCDISSLTMANSVVEIGEFAFYMCDMSEVVLPNSVTVVQKAAFNHCKNLKKVKIPVSVTELGDAVFGWCQELDTVIYEGTVAQWFAIKKGERWNDLTAVTKVVCSDGEVVL